MSTYYINAIRMSQGGYAHEHIAAVQYAAQGGNASLATEAMIAKLRHSTNHAKVLDGSREVEVGIVEVAKPYLRTHANGSYTDNLLSLPRF